MKSLPSINELVVVSTDDDTPIFRVVETDGKFGVGLVDASLEAVLAPRGLKPSVQWIDRSIVLKPTRKQLLQLES